MKSYLFQGYPRFPNVPEGSPRLDQRYGHRFPLPMVPQGSPSSPIPNVCMHINKLAKIMRAFSSSSICLSSSTELPSAFFTFSFSGCEENWNSDQYSVYPKCPKAEPICNAESKLCQATPGSILLNKIVIKTVNCTGCKPHNDGVKLNLTGSSLMFDPAKCYVDQEKGLHHPDRKDFYTNSTTVFATTDPKWYVYSRDYSFGWNTCWKVKLR